MQDSTDLIRDDQNTLRPGRFFPRPVRSLDGLEPVLARSGSLELRLATTRKDIRKAQRLRYHVFFEEGGAVPSLADSIARRDRCPYDRVSDHLMVVDTAFLTTNGRLKAKVVGTYRLIRSDMARTGLGFYSGTEFDLAPLVARHADKQLLELGRSCVHARYRSKRVIELLWKGIGLYAAHHRIDALIGCASLPGTDAAALAIPLSFAAHYAAADPEWQVTARPGKGLPMAMLPRESIDARAAMVALPPLVKAYVRVGSRFASEAAVDHAFGCTDLFTVLPLTTADPRYLAHFGSALAPLS